MIDWLATNGGMMVLIIFFLMFLGFSLWAYWPGSKEKFSKYGRIPLEGRH